MIHCVFWSDVLCIYVSKPRVRNKRGLWVPFQCFLLYVHKILHHSKTKLFSVRLTVNILQNLGFDEVNYATVTKKTDWDKCCVCCHQTDSGGSWTAPQSGTDVFFSSAVCGRSVGGVVTFTFHFASKTLLCLRKSKDTDVCLWSPVLIHAAGFTEVWRSGDWGQLRFVIFKKYKT